MFGVLCDTSIGFAPGVFLKLPGFGTGHVCRKAPQLSTWLLTLCHEITGLVSLDQCFNHFLFSVSPYD